MTARSPPLNKKTIIHKACGKRHIDTGSFATMNHRKHLCLHCRAYFYDTERSIGA